MIRILFFLIVLAALAFGFAWIADQPGSASIVLGGRSYEMDLIVAVGALIAIVVLAMIGWSMLRFIFRIPTLMSLTARARRRNKGLTALTRGMVAASAGNARVAARAARDAEKLMGDDPLALLLGAQAAQLSGDRARAEQVYRRMLEQPDTKVLGLRGLHVEARRRGDDEAAYEYARQAHEIAALSWAGEAVLERHAMADDWQGALAVVESNLARKAIDRATADRQRAVLKTAMAQRLEERDPAEALALAREAIKLAPDLVPASALAGSLLARRGDLRRAAKILEAAWKRAPHPDLARAYVELRPGDAAGDRLARAKTLGRLALGHVESHLAIARAALEARDFKLARRAMAEAMEDGRRPSVRMCLMMADIEETEHGPSGRMREWLARAARAPRDPAWVADSVVSERWLPASPVTGRLDAFNWETPRERIGFAAEDAPPPVLEDSPPPPDCARLVLDHPVLAPAAIGAVAAGGVTLAAGAATDAASAKAAEAASEQNVAEDKPQDQKPEEKTAADGAQESPPLAAPVAPVAAPAAHDAPEQPPVVAAHAAAEGDSTKTVAANDAAPAAATQTPPPSQEDAGAPPAEEPKAPLPERLVTAPDDPGPEPEPAPAPPRKRGMFG